MVPIISIVGKSDSGKTTLIEKLVRELIRRGYAVGTVKHDAHQFEIDHPGKDSWRHKQAGAGTVVVSSPAKAAVVKSVDKELTLDEIAAAYLADVDIILTEGFKREAKPKIEVLAGDDRELISPPDEVVLVATDNPEGLGLAAASGQTATPSAPASASPPAVGRDDVKEMADLIEGRFLKARPAAPAVELIVDGRPVALNPIMKAMVSNTVLGLISSLKGVDRPGTVELRLRRNRKAPEAPAADDR